MRRRPQRSESRLSTASDADDDGGAGSKKAGGSGTESGGGVAAPDDDDDDDAEDVASLSSGRQSTAAVTVVATANANMHAGRGAAFHGVAALASHAVPPLDGTALDDAAVIAPIDDTTNLRYGRDRRALGEHATVGCSWLPGRFEPRHITGCPPRSTLA